MLEGKTLETRHYITFAISFLVLQLFLFIFARTLNWVFALDDSNAIRKWLFVGVYLILNLLVLSAPLQLFQDSFRLSAFILVLLLFSTFASMIVGIGYWCIGERGETLLRIAYPILLVGFILLGIYNAYTPIVRHYQIKLDKPLAPLRIGVASDTHLGKFFGSKELEKLVTIFEQQQVDLILLPGDIMDDNVNVYLAEQMQPHLAKLHAPLGVYATMGNHDFFGDQQRIEQEIRKAGIHLLMDDSVVVDHRFVLIGRNDDLVKDRPSAEELVQQVDQTLPIILLDHRPSEVEQHSNLPIDIQFSGHTHNGQVFPANFIVKWVYRLAYGYEQIKQTHFFVTSGYGFWGVPFRLGSQSEVLIVDVSGK